MTKSKEIYNFFTSDTKPWLQQINNIIKSINDRGHADCKSFKVVIEGIKESKSVKQCRGIHRLISLLVPRFTECFGVPFDLDSAKLNVKLHFRYTRPATKQECIVEAIEIIRQADHLGIKTSIEQFNELVNKLGKSLTKPKSFADASKEEMLTLITQIEELGKSVNWPEIKLESNEMTALLEYYNNI